MSFVDDDGEENMDLGFAPSEVKKEVELLPAGQYRCAVSKVALTSNDAGDIVTAQLQFTITEGEYERRKIFARHAVKTTRAGDNMQTMVRIGREQLGELFRAAGVSGSSLQPLLDKEVLVKLKVRPARGIYDESNDVGGYKPIDGKAKPAGAGEKPAAEKGKAGSPPSFMKGKAKPAPEVEEVMDAGEPGED